MESVTLENGLTIVAKKKGDLPLVSVTLVVPGGLLAEDRDDNGISNLTSMVMLKGTKKRDEDEIVPALEEMGGSINAFSGKNSIGVAMDLPAENMTEGLDIFEDVISNATFPEEEVAKEKKKVIAAIKEQRRDIFENGVFLLQKLLYGEHPYAMRIPGNVQTVELILRKEIVAFYEKRFVPENAVMTIVGDIDPGKVITDLSKNFAKWKGAFAELPEHEVIPLGRRLQEDVTMRKEQALLLVGFQGVKITDKRKYALSLISSLLSGSDGLLFHMAREKSGITYTSGAVSVPGVDPGSFFLYVATTEENLAEAERAVFNAIKSIQTGDISEDDIASSKNQLISEYAYSLETNYAMSMTMALDELYGLRYDDYRRYPANIKTLTREEIMQCAVEIFDLDKCAVVIVHSEQEGLRF